MRSCFILAIVAAATTVGAVAQTTGDASDGAGYIVMGAWSDPAKCNRATAVPVSFDQAVKGGADLKGKCVAVEGYWAFRALFKRESDGNAARSNAVRSLRDRRIGIYARDEVIEKAPKRSKRYVLVGVFGQCESEWPDAMIVMGYCHYTGGPIIKVAEVFPANRQ